MGYYLKKNFSVLFPICLGTGVMLPLLALLFLDKSIEILAVSVGVGIIGVTGCWALKSYLFKSNKDVQQTMRERTLDEVKEIAGLLNELIVHDSCDADLQMLKNKVRFINRTIEKL